MSSWDVWFLFFATVYGTGFFALVFCARFAPEGYEDREGFHFGAEPAARAATGASTVGRQAAKVGQAARPRF